MPICSYPPLVDDKEIQVCTPERVLIQGCYQDGIMVSYHDGFRTTCRQQAEWPYPGEQSVENCVRHPRLAKGKPSTNNLCFY
jgi:hypothetical protein